jgi:hypothetical protein
MTAGKSLGDEMRLVSRVELVAEILHVPLHRSGRDAELLRALLRGQTSCNALKDFSLTL